MTTKVLGIDLRDAGRDGVYRVDPDDPVTLVADAQRAGVPLVRVDLAGCVTLPSLLARVTDAIGLPAHAVDSMDAMDDALRDLDDAAAPGHVLLFDHADDLAREAPLVFADLRDRLTSVAAHWHEQGVPFFVFLEFADNETRDAAIDA
ncbi:MAG: barstar family protein [Pseudomonadota bacterium]|nr:barstar family protein [Pseudomonadota bacterium]